MARTSDPDSATSQFFINTVDNTGLDYPNGDGNGYAVFGKVVAGMDVVKKIEGTPTTTRGPMGDVPQTNVVIQSASVVGEVTESAGMGTKDKSRRSPSRRAGHEAGIRRAHRVLPYLLLKRKGTHHGRTAYESRHHQDRTER